MTKKALEKARRLFGRRTALQGTGALLTTTLACGDDGLPADDGTGSGSGGSSSGGDGGGDTTDGGGPDDSGTTGGGTGDGTTGEPADSSGGEDGSTDESGSESGSTGETVDLTPEELLANVEHIIVLCMENRSFDHYLGSLQVAEGLSGIDGLTGAESNPDPDGGTVTVFPLTNYEPEDPPHSWSASHGSWDAGANDGFVEQHWSSGSGPEVMGYYLRSDLPVTYALADAYTICDAWFCGLLGPTWPNRYYLHCVDSSGKTDNTPASPAPTTLMQLCDDNGISNRNYYDGLAAWRWGAFPLTGFAGTATLSQFFDKLQNGGLEQVVILDPDFLSNDDHPSHNVQLGQTLIGTVYSALAASQYWDNSLLIITYDEHGGFFDHVAPPTTTDANGAEFAQRGFRVPSLVIGPHVRRGYVDHTVFGHGSFAKTVAVRFGLPDLNDRMGEQADVSSCIDPAFVDDPQPPASVPMMIVREPELLAGLGEVTSQPELFDAVGIEMPLTETRRAEHRRTVERLLTEAERLGVIERVGGSTKP